MPKVSVIIATYNCSEYLREAVESVLRQTVSDIEILIVDDGSTDNTKELVNNFINSSVVPIRYFYQKNQGPSIARNTGINDASGEWIAFLDADDVWLPEKLEKQLKLSVEAPGTNVIFSDFIYFGSKNLKHRRGFGHHDYITKIKSKKVSENGWVIQERNFEGILRDCYIHTCSVIIKKECFREAGNFDISLKQAEDWQMWLRLARKYRFGFINETLVKIRVRPDSLCRIGSEPTQYAIKMLQELPYRILDLNYRERKIIQGHLAYLNFVLGYLNFDRYEPIPARKYFLLSLCSRILGNRSIIYLLLTYMPNYFLRYIRKEKQRIFNKNTDTKTNNQVLFTNFYADLGGGELCLLAHIDTLNLKEKKIEVALLQSGPLVNELCIRKIPVHFIFWKNKNRLQRFFYSVLAIYKLYTIIKLRKINLTISYTYLDLILTAIAAKIAGVPVIWRSQAEIFPYLNQKKRWFVKLTVWFLNSFVSCIIPTTDYDKNLMLYHGVNQKLINVVRLGVELKHPTQLETPNKLRSEFNIASDAPLIGFAGRLIPWKGHKTFLEALAKVKKEIPDIKTLIAGDAILNNNDPAGYKKELLRLTEDLCLKNTVIFTGFRRDISEFMQGIDIFVHASHKEPFGMVIVEAMAAGKPVVASKVSGPQEIVKDGETGLLVEPQNADKLAKSILYLIKNHNLAKSMGQHGRERVKELFDLDKNLDEIDQYCEALITKGS